MHVARMEAMGNTYKILIGKREGRRPHGRPRRGCEDNISMDVGETVDTCEDENESSVSIRGGKFFTS